MVIYLLKFLHIIIALSLLGLSVYCIALTTSRKYTLANKHHHHKILRIHRTMLLIVVLALVSGTFLVYPKHFTFHTPWIQAAYLFCVIFVAGIFAMTCLKKKYTAPKRSTWLAIYFILIIILICVVHDAVTKSTFLF